MGFTSLFHVGYPTTRMKQWIEDHPPPESADGVGSLYAVRPQYTWDETRNMKILSGTQRAGPYHLDYSMLSSIDNGYQQIGMMAGMYDRWEYDFRSMALSSQEVYMNIAPNISSIDLHNLTAIRSANGAQMLAHNNLNMLSINLDNLQIISANSGLQRFASGTKVKCDLPSLASISGNNALQRAWSLVDPNNELQVQERLLPNLTSVIGQYAMSYAFYGYVFTQQNESLDFSRLTRISGLNAMEYAFANSSCRHCVVGLTAVPTNSNYIFNRGWINCSALTSVEFPNLSSVSSQYSFAYAFLNAKNIRRVDFPELVAISAGVMHSFQNMMHSTLAGAPQWPVCELHFPKLVSFRSNSSSNTFANVGTQTNSTLKRKYSIYLDSVTKITAGTTGASGTFYNCRGLTEVHLPSLTAVTNNYMFTNCHELSAIHFGAANEAAIRATTGFATMWDRSTLGVSCQVYFDL